jgi:hypothetical protein
MTFIFPVHARSRRRWGKVVLSVLIFLTSVTWSAIAGQSAAGASVPRCGPTWEPVAAANIGNSQLRDVTAAHSGALWAVGDYFRDGQDYALIERMTRNGWLAVPSNAPETTILNSVSAASRDDIWAAGYDTVSSRAHPFIEHWDGSSWAQVTAPSMVGYLNGIYAAGRDDAWAVGVTSNVNDNGYVTLIEHWDGSSWSVVPSPDGSGSNWLSAVSGTSASEVWAVGWYGNDRQRTLAEQWDGVNWRIVPTPNTNSPTNHLQDVVAVSASDVWTVGYSDGSRRLTLAEHWNGTGWYRVATPNANSETNQLIGVGGISRKEVWAVGEYYRGGWKSLAQYWNGHSWRITTSPDPVASNEVNAVTVLPGDSAWSVGESYQDGVAPQSLSREICPAVINDSRFQDPGIIDRCWQSVLWATSASSHSDHTVSDDSGMRLFGSGRLGPGTPYAFTFFSSGTYPIIDQRTSAKQLIIVPMDAWPSRGSLSTDFTLKWASVPAPPGYTYGVQIKSPKIAHFTPLVTTGTNKTTFVPSGGSGTYQFKARLVKMTDGLSSQWSPSVTISVTS